MLTLLCICSFVSPFNNCAMAAASFALQNTLYELSLTRSGLKRDIQGVRYTQCISARQGPYLAHEILLNDCYCSRTQSDHGAGTAPLPSWSAAVWWPLIAWGVVNAHWHILHGLFPLFGHCCPAPWRGAGSWQSRAQGEAHMGLYFWNQLLYPRAWYTMPQCYNIVPVSVLHSLWSDCSNYHIQCAWGAQYNTRATNSRKDQSHNAQQAK